MQRVPPPPQLHRINGMIRKLRAYCIWILRCDLLTCESIFFLATHKGDKTSIHDFSLSLEWTNECDHVRLSLVHKLKKKPKLISLKACKKKKSNSWRNTVILFDYLSAVFIFIIQYLRITYSLVDRYLHDSLASFQNMIFLINWLKQRSNALLISKVLNYLRTGYGAYSILLSLLKLFCLPRFTLILGSIWQM